MGLFLPFVCSSKEAQIWRYRLLYILIAAGLVVLGTLYQTGHLDSPFDSRYWYASVAMLTLSFIVTKLASKFINKRVSKEWKSVIWAYSHYFNYFLLTFFSPKEWPFWLAASVLWEGYECWTTCLNKEETCSGFLDIMINVAGTFTALSIRLGAFNGGKNWSLFPDDLKPIV